MNLESDSVQLLVDYIDGKRETVAQQILERYHARLNRLARSRLSEQLRRRVDPEDILQSVYRSFFRRADNNEFEIYRSGTLWRLLGGMTIKKVLKRAEKEYSQKRTPDAEDHATGVANLLNREPNPEEVVDLIDEIKNYLSTCDERTQLIVECRVRGESVEQIAKTIDTSEATTRRTIKRVVQDLEERLHAPEFD